jgi:hypothetical protein
MATKTLFKLGEIITLSEEIHGLQDRQSGAKVQNGLLDEKINLVQKYWLNDLGKKTKDVADELEPLRNDLIKKYGDESPDGSIGVSAFHDIKNEEGVVVGKQPNPKWAEFQNEYGALLDQEREIEHHEFLLGDFSEVKTENRYAIFMDKVIRP